MVQTISGLSVLMIDDVYKIVNSLLKQDDITLVTRKDYIANSKPNGYRSLHLVVAAPAFFVDQKGAPVFILVSSKTPAPKMENVAYSNAAIIAHNMALEATELGIGTCYIWGAVAAITTSPDIVKELDLPENFIPCCGIVLGQTDCRYELRDIPTDRIAKNSVE